MIRKLLGAIAEIETFHDEPQDVARQFLSWVSAVEHALAAAGMDTERSTWNAAGENIRFTEDSSAFVMHMKAMKAVLLGIHHRIGGSEASAELLDPQLL